MVSTGKESSEIKRNVRHSIDLIGGIQRFIKRGDKVLIKPNFVAPFPKATTNLAIIGEVVEEVRDCGAEPIIAESSGFEFDTEATFDILGVREFAHVIDVKLINLEKQEIERIKVNHRFIKEMRIPRIVLDTDVLINVPKMKMHKLTYVSLGLKNLIGLLDRETKRKIHILGLDTGILALSDVIQPEITIVDGLSFIRDAAVYGESTNLGVIISGDDTVSVDRVCCELLNIKPAKARHIWMAISNNSFLDKDIKVIRDYNYIRKIDIKSNMLKIMISRTLYNLMHLIDYFYSRVNRGKTLIPYLNWKFGIRPVVIARLCDRCGLCIEACPSQAIDKETIKIDYTRCMHVRCLKCVEVCPINAIETKRFMFKYPMNLES